MSNELATLDSPLSVEKLKSQVNLIQHVMKEVMKKDEHYGVIKGCGDKPTLLKAGAEKLAFVFGLCPEFVVEEKNLPKDHREYRVITTLKSRQGNFLGQGVGVASTMETKWRYRKGKADATPTGQPVPKNYWDLKNKGELEAAQNAIGGKGYGVKKIEGNWEIVELKAGEREEHDNPSDYFNTVLKMSKKRSLIDSILTCTAASDIFTQDIEEMVESGAIEVKAEVVENKKAETLTQEPSDYISATILDVKKRTGKKANGEAWTSYDIKFVDNEGQEKTYSTFSQTVGENSQNAIGAPVNIKIETKGKYTNITDMRIASAPQTQDPEDSIPF